MNIEQSFALVKGDIVYHSEYEKDFVFVERTWKNSEGGKQNARCFHPAEKDIKGVPLQRIFDFKYLELKSKGPGDSGYNGI